MYGIKFICVVPTRGKTPIEQLKSCLLDLEETVRSYGFNIGGILKQTVFLRTEGKADFFNNRKTLYPVLQDFYGFSVPPTSFIGQAPESHKSVSLEVIVSRYPPEGTEIEGKTIGDIRYTVVGHLDYKEVYAAGLIASENVKGTSDQAQEAFELMTHVLGGENMTFSNVVRQWNYIEDILGTTSSEEGLKQNYQLFNDVRSAYYDTADFRNGYPAATGIGMNAGGVVVEFIAVSASKDFDVIPLSNPRQVDAHKYSQDVLVGSPDKNGQEMAPPKFERAKLVSIKNRRQIFISGTAAIIGQDTAVEKDVEGQTKTTAENILKLVSRENLKNSGVPFDLDPRPLSHIRVYVKNEADIPRVKKVCENFLKSTSSLYLVSDICRNDLLVEIEGVMDFF